MSKKDELVQELENAFEKIKKELGFRSTLEDLDKVFYIKDFVLKDGFVSESFSRQLCHRIVGLFMDWNDYLHSLIIPNPQNLLNMSESKILSQEEKKEIIELMKKVMELSSRNGLIGLNKDKKAESEFIDYSLRFWNDEFKPRITKIIKKINKEWNTQ